MRLQSNQMTLTNAKSIGNFLGHFVEVDESTKDIPSIETHMRIRSMISIENPFLTGFHSK